MRSSAVLSILLVGRRQFLGRDAQIEFLRMADDRNFRRDANRRSEKVPVQRINSRNGLVLERHNNVALSQTSAAGGTSRLKTNDQDATIQWQPVKADHPRVNGHLLTSHSDPTSPDTTFLNQPGGHKLGRVAGDGKANSLCGKNDGCVDADDLSARVDERTARVTRIQGGIGLDDVIDEPS